MKIVCCYVPGQLRDETIDALADHIRPTMSLDLVELREGDAYAYRRIISWYWMKGEDFMVVEPDIVVRGDVMEAYDTCSCIYGCFPYAWLTDVGPALGCTWFRAEFIKMFPDAVALCGNVTWRQLDVVLMRHVLARKYGQQPHVHLPAVQHLNEAKQLLPEANPEPLMRVPHF